MNRRTLLKGAGAGLGLAALGATPAKASNVLQVMLGKAGLTTRHAKTPVKHLVVVMLENRSANHFLGWYGAENPNFDGHQQAQFRDLRKGVNGPMVATRNWGRNGLGSYHGRGFADPSHSWDGGRLERSGGSAQGWLHPGTKNDEFALGYYDAADVPVWAQLVRNFQAYDRWHCSLLGPTQPNRYYMHSGQSGGLKNNDTPPQVALLEGHPEWSFGWDWPTIWTLCDRFGVSSANYFSNLPELAYWGARHVSSLRHVSEYFAQAATGTLPSVSFVQPFFTVSDDFGNDDHPHADLRLGQAFLSDVVEAFINSPNYRESAMVITYDEWGGFWDHVAPPRIADQRGTNNDPGGPEDFAQIGFRIPSVIISPWTRTAGAVDHTLYDHASVVRFIQDNWSLPNLTVRTASTNSIEHAFNGFQNVNRSKQFKTYHAPPKALFQSGIDAFANFIEAELKDPTHVPATPFSTHEKPGVEVLRDIGWMDKYGIRTDWKLQDGFANDWSDLINETNGVRR